MTNDSGKTLLKDGFELPESPPYTKAIQPAAITSLVNDAMDGQHTCPSCIALEEANQALALQIDVLLLEKRALEDRAMGKVYE